MTDEKAIEKMLYDQQQGWPLCPRCGERMPDKLTHGALSRHANIERFQGDCILHAWRIFPETLGAKL